MDYLEHASLVYSIRRSVGGAGAVLTWVRHDFVGLSKCHSVCKC